MSILFELISIAFQITGFVFLLPNFDKKRWKRFGFGEITKKTDKVIIWIANYGPKYGIYIILIGFGFQVASLFD